MHREISKRLSKVQSKLKKDAVYSLQKVFYEFIVNLVKNERGVDMLNYMKSNDQLSDQ